jgi:RNA polymerase sigma factor (sigma-70 family)
MGGAGSWWNQEVPPVASPRDSARSGVLSPPTAEVLDLSTAPPDGDQPRVSGNYPGLSETCVREYPRLVRLLTLYCSDRDVALDLAQETMVRACMHWHKVAGSADQRAWLTRVALNLANSRWRRIRVERRVLPTLAETDGGLPGPDIDTALAVRYSLGRLTPRQRMAVVLRYFDDLDLETTAGIMGCSPGTVKKLTARGLATLRPMLGLTEPTGEEASHG